MAENLVINGVTFPSVDTIEVENTDGETVSYGLNTLKYFDAKSWEFTLTGLVVNSNGVVLQDDWLKEHCNDANLCFYCIKQNDRTNIFGNARSNDATYCPFGGGDRMGERFSSTSWQSTLTPFNYSAMDAAGFMYVNQNGELIYRNGSGVRWTDGTYKAFAWLA